MVEILGREKFDKLLILEALFISVIKPSLNTKDEFKRRALRFKIILIFVILVLPFFDLVA